jgi:2-methylisocitrate lyase-like PEP mutase family enzyme
MVGVLQVASWPQMSGNQVAKGEAFRALHGGDAFVIPNPWDAGSAKLLQSLGFKALATTSQGFAFTLGRPDGSVSLDEVLAHVAAVDAATGLPVSVDLEHGYGPSPEQVALAISSVAEVGAVGGSIEDWDPDDGVIYEIGHATERIAAAVEAAAALGFPFTLTARAENYVRGRHDIDDTIARLLAFEEAGADVLYAPRVPGIEDIRAICGAVTKPVNVLGLHHLDLGEIVAAGAQRISVGSQLYLGAVTAFADAARRINDGDLGALPSTPWVPEWLGPAGGED